MTLPKFVQIHFLTSYAAALLNRDDSGLAKRLPYGGAMRTRVSSQCQKRHWRVSDSVFALGNIDGAEDSFRSRDLVTKLIRGPFEGQVPAAVLDAVEPLFQAAVYGKDGAAKSKRQPLLMGAPEIRFLKDKFEEIVTATSDPDEAKAAAEAFCADKDFKATMKAMREGAALHMGLPAALFGRMVTSDTTANIDAPIHVAHAFTVHAEETESDYFAVVDDLSGPGDAGADHIGEVEINSGLYYGNVVIDVPGLVSNLTGTDRAKWTETDRTLAAEVVAHLINLVAETSPGAKKGSTAPHAYAHTVLVELGDRQPRTLAAAFRTPVRPSFEASEEALAAHLGEHDRAYETGEARRFLSLRNAAQFPGAERATMRELTDWVRGAILDGAA
jgi:CRISPR system Cascade subunit CasC